MLRTLLIAAIFMPALRAAEIEVLLPEKSEQITHVNVKKLASSTLFKTMLMKEIREKLKDSDVPKWLKEAGIDPWKDIDTLSMVMNAPKYEADKDGKMREVKEGMGFVVMRGKFDGGKLIDTMEKAIAEAGDMFSMIKEDGLKIVKFKPKNGQEFYLTMMDEQTIVGATSTKLLHTAAKLADDKDAKSAVKNELAALVKSLDDKAAFYQASVFDGSDIAKNIGENPLFDDIELLKKQVADITSYSITARVGTDVTIEFATGMKTKDAAVGFGETAKAMVEKGRTLLPLVAAGKPEFGGIIGDLKKSMKVSVEADIVKLSAKITGDAIGKAFGVEE